MNAKRAITNKYIPRGSLGLLRFIEEVTSDKWNCDNIAGLATGSVPCRPETKFTSIGHPELVRVINTPKYKIVAQLEGLIVDIVLALNAKWLFGDFGRGETEPIIVPHIIGSSAHPSEGLVQDTSIVGGQKGSHKNITCLILSVIFYGSVGCKIEVRSWHRIAVISKGFSDEPRPQCFVFGVASNPTLPESREKSENGDSYGRYFEPRVLSFMWLACLVPGCWLFIAGNDSWRSNLCGLILIIGGFIIQLNYPLEFVFSENVDASATLYLLLRAWKKREQHSTHSKATSTRRPSAVAARGGRHER
jgi:hypothetical protein